MSEFDPRALENSYAYIDDIPDELFELVVDARGGTLAEIAEGVVRLRDTLLDGSVPLPGEVPWPSVSISEPILSRLNGLDIARFCREQPELTDELLSSVVKAFNRAQREAESRKDAIFDELSLLERQRQLREDEFDEEKLSKEELDALRSLQDEPWERWLDKASEVDWQSWTELANETLEELDERAEQRATQAAAEAAGGVLFKQWSELAEAWDQVAEVFNELATLLGRGWDFARGIVQTDGWLDVVRMRELVQSLPELEELVRILGRMEESTDDEQSVYETVFENIKRSGERLEECRTPHAPLETRGICLSNDLTRMLPAEAVNLTRPALKRLWVARWTEHALSTYRVEGVMAERIEYEEDIEEELERESEESPRERGPVIVCLDTSGSMSGSPERVAKALTLEAVRVAQQEGRRCFVYAFSGPHQVEEQEISLEAEAFGQFLAFLRRSFRGGPDVEAPLKRAIQRLETEDWEKADLLMISDGIFRVSAELVSRIQDARDATGARMHGVLVANRKSSAMAELCDELHQFSSWESLGGSPGTQPGGVQ